MSKRRSNGLEIENLDKWLEWLKTLETGKVEEMKDRIARSAGFKVLEHADDLTPRKTGRLQNSLNFGDKDNYFKLKVGRTTYVAVGTAVEYAAAVEEGFQQKEGRFIPGYWKGDTFHYDRNAGGGMVLTGKVIEGAHMFKKALDRLDDGDLSEIVEFEFRRLYADLLGK